MKRCMIGVIVFSVLFLGILTPRSHAFSFSALSGMPFGGFVSYIIPCTCSGAILLVFDRLFIGLPTPIPSGALLYQLGSSRPYANFNAGTPRTWNIGAYRPVPAVQTMCMVGIPPACAPAIAPVAGVGIIQYVGTSRPGLGVFGF
jgi:hypothetical protein